MQVWQAGSRVLGGSGIEAKPQAPLLLLLAVRALHPAPRPRGPPAPPPRLSQLSACGAALLHCPSRGLASGPPLFPWTLPGVAVRASSLLGCAVFTLPG